MTYHPIDHLADEVQQRIAIGMDTILSELDEEVPQFEAFCAIEDFESLAVVVLHQRQYESREES